MLNLTEFIETMRRNDVYSIDLEFHPPTAYAPEKEGSDVELTIYGGSVALPGVKFCRVEFFPPQQKPEPQDPEKKPVPAAAEPVPKPEPVPLQPVKAVEPTAAAPQAAAEAKPVEAVKKPEPEPEKRAEEPVKPKRESEKAKSEAEAPKPQPESAAAQPPLPPPAGVYDVFVETIEQDDGTKTEVKRLMISKMTLDDMLRVNASFQLGLDTDVATEALRNEITSCFI